MVSLCGVQTERHQWQAIASSFAHHDESQLLQVGCQVICCACQVHHNTAIALFAEPDHLVVLADDLRSTFGEVERE